MTRRAVDSVMFMVIEDDYELPSSLSLPVRARVATARIHLVAFNSWGMTNYGRP